MTRLNGNVQDVELDIIKDQFHGDLDFYKGIERAVDTGPPIFKKEDLYIPFPLDKLFRYFCILKSVSKNKLKTAMMNYLRHIRLDNPAKVNHEWTNLLKTVCKAQTKNGLTFAHARRLFSHYLGYNIVDIQFTLYSPANKEEIKISLSDVEDFLKSGDEGFIETKRKETIVNK